MSSICMLLFPDDQVFSVEYVYLHLHSCRSFFFLLPILHSSIDKFWEWNQLQCCFLYHSLCKQQMVSIHVKGRRELVRENSKTCHLMFIHVQSLKQMYESLSLAFIIEINVFSGKSVYCLVRLIWLDDWKSSGNSLFKVTAGDDETFFSRHSGSDTCLF